MEHASAKLTVWGPEPAKNLKGPGKFCILDALWWNQVHLIAIFKELNFCFFETRVDKACFVTATTSEKTTQAIHVC